MQDVAIHVTEALKTKGKRLQDACVEEVAADAESARSVGIRPIAIACTFDVRSAF